MRRDIGFYVDAPVQQVYEAYLKAATTKPFERTCEQKPYYSISFGVNYSFKYNMNGGACHIHFIPKGSGTAINMRFTIAQAFGARYEQYAQDLTNATRSYLAAIPRPASYDVEEFMNPCNQVTPAGRPVVVTPQAAPAPAAPAAQPDIRYCVKCGGALAPGGRFCPHCGTQLTVPAPKSCPNCQTPAEPNAAFCANCGTRL